jgi:hypothetical protein
VITTLSPGRNLNIDSSPVHVGLHVLDGQLEAVVELVRLLRQIEHVVPVLG